MSWCPRMMFLVLVLATAVRAAEPESGLFFPLAVEPNPSLTESLDAIQKRFLSVARNRSGYELLLLKEVEYALKDTPASDYAQSNASLAKLARKANVAVAGYVALRVAEGGELILDGRLVQADGKLLKAAMVAVPRGKEALIDAISRAAEKFFDRLNAIPVPAEPLAVAVPTPTKPGTPPPMVAVPKPVEPPNPGTPLRILGAVLGGAGVATAVVGAVVFANAGTVEKDANGNIAAADASKVKGIRSQQGAALGLVTAGTALGLTGIVMLIAAPTAPVTAALAPRADGAMFVVEGSF